MKIKQLHFIKVAIFALILSVFPVYVINAQSDRDKMVTSVAAVGRGVENAKKKDYDSALSEYTEAIRLLNSLRIKNSSSYEVLSGAYGLRAMVYYEKGDYDRGIADCTESIKLDGNDARIFYYRGMMYSKKENWDLAIADFTQTIRINPKNEGAFFYRGNAYYFKGDSNRAIADWEALLKLDPNNAGAKRNIDIARNLQK